MLPPCQEVAPRKAILKSPLDLLEKCGDETGQERKDVHCTLITPSSYRTWRWTTGIAMPHLSKMERKISGNIDGTKTNLYDNHGVGHQSLSKVIFPKLPLLPTWLPLYKRLGPT